MPVAPNALFVVRGREADRYWYASPVRTAAPFRMEGIFATRDQAEAFLARCLLRARAERFEYIQGGVGYKLVEMDLPL
jgi:hypothetical protein